MWTRFFDMHSGGGQKLDWNIIFIEAPKEEAKSVFFARFGRNPERVTCTCCGEDYSIDEAEQEEVDDSGGEQVKIIWAEEIDEWELHVAVPIEGYVWGGGL